MTYHLFAFFIVISAISTAFVSCERTKQGSERAIDKITTEAEQVITPSPASQADPQNTARNVRDRDERALTPTDQAENEVDRSLTQRIRQMVVDDDSLSVTAENVKIITINGMVTLRGPVRTEAEKRRIEEIATSVAGAGRVSNQLEVAVSQPENE